MTTTPEPTAAPQIVKIRVQVYATIVHGKAYILAFFAPIDRFDAGVTNYFTPMLKTLRFLTPAP